MTGAPEAPGPSRPRGAGRVLLVIFALKSYGLLVLYVLFLRTPARERIGESFLFLEEGQTRSERIEEIEAGFFERLVPFDGQWYLDIARKGYRGLGALERLGRDFPEGNFAFFRLVPAILRPLRAVTPHRCPPPACSS